MIRSIFLAVAVAATLTAVAQPATDKPMVHDPVLAYENGTYYLFATGHGIQQMTSTDLTNWTVVREPLIKDIPAWTHDSVPGFKNHVWAPDVIYHHNRWWVAYSCSTFGKNGSAIGLMSNVTLDGRYPWRDEGCIVCSHENSEQWNAIDPNFIVDEDGTAWMTYGSFWFMDSTLAANEYRYNKNLESLRTELSRCRDEFILEHFRKYDTPEFPPSWKTLEVASFGTLSKLYNNMNDFNLMKRVARDFDMPQHEYQSSEHFCSGPQISSDKISERATRHDGLPQ